MRKTSRPRGAVLIAAVSGRALARAAVAAGYDALVADYFADTDTQDLAAACVKLDGPIAKGMQWRELSKALEALAKAAPSPVRGLVYGAGFEDRPHLLDRIAAQWTLLGNDAETVAKIKSPETFFATLDRLGIAHPATVFERPVNGAGWIAKRRGGAGGSHVVPSRLQKAGANVYYQVLVEGRAVSALFLANGRDASVIGFSEQWTAPAPGRLWRYGGAVQPAACSEAERTSMTRAVRLATKAFAIRGLASADFIFTENQPHLLEINPRPGGTLDIFAHAAKPLLELHLDAVADGRLPRKPLPTNSPAASAILYALARLVVPRNLDWPSWVADRPSPGEWIDKQRPICTVLARAGTKERAKRLVETRKTSVLANIQKSNRGKQREQEQQREKRDETNEAAERQ